MTQLQIDLDKIDGASEDEMPLLTLRFLARIANALEAIAGTNAAKLAGTLQQHAAEVMERSRGPKP